MHPVPKSPTEALAIYLDPASEEWERDYAALMIGELEEGRAALLATARNSDESAMLQQRAAEALSFAWRDLGVLMTADTSGFAPSALQEIRFRRGEGPPFEPW